MRSPSARALARAIVPPLAVGSSLPWHAKARRCSIERSLGAAVSVLSGPRNSANLCHIFPSEISSWLLQLRLRRTSSTGSGYGQDDRLERAAEIDRHGVEQR